MKGISKNRSYQEYLAKHIDNLIALKSKIAEIVVENDSISHLLAKKENSSAIFRLRHQTEALNKNANLSISAFTYTNNQCNQYEVILMPNTLNRVHDIQKILEDIHVLIKKRGRLVISLLSSLWRPLFFLAAKLGLRNNTVTLNWLSVNDIQNLLMLSNWDIIRTESKIIAPFPFGLFGRFINKWFAPFVPFLCINYFVVARPRCRHRQAKVSVIVPARNEQGNIRQVYLRTPKMGRSTEIIFIEGHSSDNTWSEIMKIVQNNGRNLPVRAFHQPGKGKGDAVRAGFQKATGDILMILDADLTVPPEDLPKFYRALICGTAEFANGVRLVYPMENQAMRFLNLMANHFFSRAFSWVLGQPIKDTLCGTKVLWKKDWEKIKKNRSYFGDFDPFGDFDLLFGADRLNLKIADIPIRYRQRVYGSTNIQRWRHGAILFRMLVFAAYKIKFI